MKFNEIGIDIYTSIRNRQSFEIKNATRSEIKFENVETNFPSINFDYPFVLASIFLPSSEDILVHEAAGMIHLDLIDRIRLLVNLYQGTIVYKKKSDEDWTLYINFK